MLSLSKHPAVRRIEAFRYARSFDFAQDDSLGGTPTPETKACAGVLINGMCLFGVSVCKANA